jgi:hypothetical protein
MPRGLASLCCPPDIFQGRKPFLPRHRPLNIAPQILAERSGPPESTATNRAGIDNCAARPAYRGYFDCCAFEVTRYRMILSGRFRAKLDWNLTARTFPISRTDSSSHSVRHMNICPTTIGRHQSRAGQSAKSEIPTNHFHIYDRSEWLSSS